MTRLGFTHKKSQLVEKFDGPIEQPSNRTYPNPIPHLNFQTNFCLQKWQAHIYLLLLKFIMIIEIQSHKKNVCNK